MAEKIKISDLFDFSDVQDLETLYRRLEQINQIYKELAKNINQESKTIQTGISATEKEVKKLADALKVAGDSADIKKLSDQIEKQAAANKKLVAQNEKLVEQNRKLKESQKAVNEEGKEAERLLKEQERLKAKISKATGEEAKQNAILKLELQRVNKEVRDQAKAIITTETAYQKLKRQVKEANDNLLEIGASLGTSSKEFQEAKKRANGLTKELENLKKETKEQPVEVKKLETAYERLRRETSEAKREALEIGAAFGKSSKEFKTASKRAKELNDNLSDLNADVGNFQGNVGNYASALDSINGNLSGLVGLAGPAGIALAAVTVGVEAIGALAETVQETNQQLKETAQLTQLSGEALTEYTSQVRATAKVFDQEYKEVLRAANAVSKEFGISGAEAIDLINQGFVQGANINDDYLDQLREYSTQFKAAGLSAQDFNNVVALGAREGIFNDKAADTVKEAGLRLREFNKATADSLQPLGAQTIALIKQEVAAGNSFKAIQLVSEGLQNTALTAQQTQSIITNTFGGPGEDAGQRFIELLATIDTNQKAVLDNLTEQQKQQLRILEIEEELSNAEVKLGEAFKSSGKELSIFFKQLQTVGIEGLLDVIEKVNAGVDELKPLFDEAKIALNALGEALGFTGEGFGDILSFLNPLRRQFDNTIASFKFLLQLITFGAELLTNFVIQVKSTTNSIFEFATSFEFVSSIIDGFTMLFKDLFAIFAETPNLLNGLTAAFTEAFTQIRDRAFRAFGDVKDVILGILTFDTALIVQAFKSSAVNFENGGREVAEAFKRGYNEVEPITTAVEEDTKKATETIKKAQKEQAATTKEQQKKDKDAQDKALQERLKAIDDAATEERIKLKQERADQLISEQDFQDELLLLRLETLEKQKEALEAAGKDTLAIEEQINDILLDEQKKGEEAGLKQQEAAAKKSLELKKKEDADKLKAEQEAQEARANLASDPIVQAGFDALETRIENELVLAGIQAFRAALEQGKTAQEALQDGTKAVAAAQVFKSLSKGFHDAGYTGDGGEWDVAGVVHKGEMVQTAKQTKKYGMRGWSANDFDNAIDSGYFTQFAKTNNAIADQMNLNNQTLVVNDNSDVVKAVKDGFENMPTEQLKPLAEHLQHQQKMGKRQINTTYKYGRSCR